MESKPVNGSRNRGLNSVSEFNPAPNPPYPHEVRFTPTYVIQRLQNTQIMESRSFAANQSRLEATPNSDQAFTEQDLVHGQGQPNDPFTLSFQGEGYTKKWSHFLSSVKMPTAAYDNNTPTTGSEHDNYNLDSEWRGEQRLRDIFDCEDGDRVADDNEKPSISSVSSTTDPVLERQHYNWRVKEREIKLRARKWFNDNRTNWRSKLIDSVMENSYIPLFFRLLLITLSSIALGISGRLVHVTVGFDINQQASPLMALVVQAVSIAYLLYISYDEFTSQPLGLRDPKAKIRLVLIDLLFIIFSSANVSLSFVSQYDSEWVCHVNNLVSNMHLCREQRTLSGILMLIIVFWCITFTISLFRIVNATQIRNW